MWPSTWSNTPFTGCPPCQSPNNPFGPHPGALPCGGGCNPTIHAIGPQAPQCSPTGQWAPPGQGVWRPQNLMGSPGMGPGCHHQGIPLHATSQSSQPVPFPQGVPHNVLSPAQPVVPHTVPFQAQHGVPHTLPPQVQQGVPTSLDSQQTSGATLHHQQDQGPGIPTSTQSSTSALTTTQLEQRLGEAMDKKLESMTEALRASMSHSMESHPATSPTMQDRGLDSRRPRTSEVRSRQDQGGLTLAHLTSTGTEAQQHDIPPMLTSKAKPPTRPEETTPSHTTSRSIRATSRRRSTFRRSRDKRTSRSQGGRRKPLPRHRAHSHQPHREEHNSPTPRSYTPPGHRERSAPHDRSGRREEVPDRTSMTTSKGERNLSHPIYQRSNAIRKRSSNADSWNQIHSDANTTVFARSSQESHHREPRHRQDRPVPPITLRS